MESNKKIFRSNSIRTLCTLPLFLLPIAEMNGTTTYAQSVQFSFSLSLIPQHYYKIFFLST